LVPIALHPEDATGQNLMAAKKAAKSRVGRMIRRPPAQNSLQDTSKNLPIVGIGASAGGLRAFEQFFANMPPDSGMAFVLVSHLDPSHASCWNKSCGRIGRSTNTSWNMTFL
jgi:chemotaxis response regulator CheB